MSIKIIGGLAKGLALVIPSKTSVRPTSVLLRRRIFDHYQNLSHSIFIDCCAGSGGMGLEAWSREADAVYLLEIEGRTFSFLLKNIEKIQNLFKEEYSLRKIMTFRTSVEKWLAIFLKEFDAWPEDKKNSTIFFLDPPYKKWEIYQFVIEKIKGLHDFHGQLWVESSKLEGPSLEKLEAWGKKCEKSYYQGTNFISIFQF